MVESGDSTGKRRAAGARLGWASGFCSALLLLIFATFFALLITGVFEMFRQADRLLQVGAWRGWGGLARGALLVFCGIMAVRCAWRLTLSLVGLLTGKYDEGVPADAAELELRGALGDLVREVCQRISAPQPDELRVAADDECYVLELREFAVRTQRRLILVLGMPHLLVMTVAEIQVILAHELAHFRQGDTRLIVFLYRLDKTLRISARELGRHWWRWIDPVYWLFSGFHRLVLLASAPWQRIQELRADQASAEAFGGAHAADTLLKEWLVEGQFEESLEAFGAAEDRGAASVYAFFAQRWTNYSPETHEYLERRLTEFERPGLFDPRPTIGARLSHMRMYPDVAPLDQRPVRELIPKERLEALCAQLESLSPVSTPVSPPVSPTSAARAAR